MSDSIIFNPAGVQVGKGQNLDIVSRRAKEYGGVARITIKEVQYAGAPGRYWGDVRVHYCNGYYAVVGFVDYDHAVEWAYAKSKASARASWYAGCIVYHNLFFK